MYAQDTYRSHLNILRSQIVAIVLALVLTIGGMSASWYAQNQSIETESVTQEQVAESNSFYQIIAGNEQADSVDASDQLAVELSRIFATAETEAEFEQAVSEYSAGARDFPGITESLGYNPFDATGRSCEECGKLNATTVADLRSVVVDNNVAAVTQPVTGVDTTITTTPFGVPVWLVLLLVWQIAGAAGLAFGLWRYGGRSLTWKRDGMADGLERASKVASPIAYYGYQWFYNRRKLAQLKQRDLDKIESYGMGEQLRTIERTLEELKALPPGTYDELADTIGALERQRATILAYPAMVAISGRRADSERRFGEISDLLREGEDRIAGHQAALQEAGFPTSTNS